MRGVWFSPGHAGKAGPAKELLATALEGNPGDTLAQFEMARVCFYLLDLDAAGQAIGQAVKLQPEDGRYHYWMGLISIYCAIWKHNSPESRGDVPRLMKAGLGAFKKAMALGGNPLKAGTLSDSAFAIASNHGHTDILAHIFKNTQVPADMATSMLATALKDSRFEVAETCLQLGADPNHVVPGVGAPMHTLAVLGPDKPQLFAFLVQHGADTGLLNQKGESVLELASQFRKKKIVA